MKIFQYLLIISIAFSNPSTALCTNTEFDKAVQLYASGAYDEALKLFAALSDSGMESVSLYQNMAACHYRLNEYPEAILCYEKALKLDPVNKSIKKDLEITRKKIAGLKTSVPPFILWSYWLYFCSLSTETGWIIISIAFGFLTVACIYLWLGDKLTNSALSHKILIPTGIFAFLVCTLASFTLASIRKDDTRFVAMQENMVLHQGPDSQSPEIDHISKGERIKKLDEIGRWMEVVLPDGTSGWVQSDNLIKI
jgi:tetratricopeptide (TPR) repeat protein